MRCLWYGSTPSPFYWLTSFGSHNSKYDNHDDDDDGYTLFVRNQHWGTTSMSEIDLLIGRCSATNSSCGKTNFPNWSDGIGMEMGWSTRVIGRCITQQVLVEEKHIAEPCLLFICCLGRWDHRHGNPNNWTKIIWLALLLGCLIEVAQWWWLGDMMKKLKT